MANALQKAAFRRRVIYGVAIFALFSLSMFWRGKLAVPFSSQVPQAAALSDQSVLAKAEQLELRELDQGDPEIAGATARLAIVGARGVVVTGLWYAAIEKFKRNEFHEFEILARAVTRLQPNFITPWVFQSWNISYNASVEHEKLGDMYYFIARGIEVAAEGDRMNSKVIRDKSGESRKVGSPDLRYQIGFYYQNKFSVSDKVSTLRCLMQLSCIKPTDRRREVLQRNGQVDLVAFKRFCATNPQLVRRLRTKLACDQPSDVVQFLRDNEKIPTLYTIEGELLPADAQFPILPEGQSTGKEEYYPGKPVDDTFDAFHAARAWYSYSIPVIPPNKRDKGGDPLPWRSPKAGEYDPIRYRMPRAPALAVFRQSAPRSQSYLAERLTKEGWFDRTSGWDVDETAGTNNRWFAPGANGEPVVFTTQTSAQEAWQRAYEMWQEHGNENAMIISESRRYALMATAGVRSTPTSLIPDDLTDEQFAERGQNREQVEATNALLYYEQNQSFTNFRYFLESAGAERSEITVEARKLLYAADAARTAGRSNLAVERYRTALAKWRQVLVTFKDFHRPQGSDTNEEATYEYELNLIGLLKEDGAVRERARKTTEIAGAVFGPFATRIQDDILQAVAEDEATLIVAAETILKINPTLNLPADDAGAKALAEVTRTLEVGGALGAVFSVPAVTQEAVVRGVINGKYPWMKEFKYEPKTRDEYGQYEQNAYWVRPTLRDSIRQRLGLVRKVAPAADVEAELRKPNLAPSENN